MCHTCLRVGEAVLSSSDDHTIKIDNVHIIEQESSKSIEISLESYKHSKKTSKFILSENYNSKYSPVQAFLDFLKLRLRQKGVVFIDPCGLPIKISFLANKIKFLIACLGLDKDCYNTHSLRIGRATDLAREGTPEAVIKQTGRWTSEAYLKYIRFDNFTLPF